MGDHLAVRLLVGTQAALFVAWLAGLMAAPPWVIFLPAMMWCAWSLAIASGFIAAVFMVNRL